MYVEAENYQQAILVLRENFSSIFNRIRALLRFCLFSFILLTTISIFLPNTRKIHREILQK